MFDTLTPAERFALRGKLAEWAHKSADVAHVLARTALADEGMTNPVVWDQSERHYAVMEELYDLRTEIPAAS